MTVFLYRNSSDNTVLNKQLTTTVTYTNVFLLEETALTTPTFILVADYKQVGNYNYLYCEDMGKRYYYITDIKSLDSERVAISCKTDVLMSFKDDILKSKISVDRSTANNLPLIADSALSTAARATVILKKFSGCEFLPTVTATDNSVVLTTIGG